MNDKISQLRVEQIPGLMLVSDGDRHVKMPTTWPVDGPPFHARWWNDQLKYVTDLTRRGREIVTCKWAILISVSTDTSIFVLKCWSWVQELKSMPDGRLYWESFIQKSLPISAFLCPGQIIFTKNWIMHMIRSLLSNNTNQSKRKNDRFLISKRTSPHLK